MGPTYLIHTWVILELYYSALVLLLECFSLDLTTIFFCDSFEVCEVNERDQIDDDSCYMRNI